MAQMTASISRSVCEYRDSTGESARLAYEIILPSCVSNAPKPDWPASSVLAGQISHAMITCQFFL